MPEAIGVKVRHVRNTAVSIPFESTKTRRWRAYFHLCVSGDFNSNYGISIVIFRCDTSRCASNQADGNAPVVRHNHAALEQNWKKNIRLTHLLEVEVLFRG